MDLTRSTQRQGQVFQEALIKFEERNEIREDLWREYPPDDKIGHMRSKLARLEHMVPRLEGDDRLKAEIEDDAIDLINYTAFLIRKVRGE